MAAFRHQRSQTPRGLSMTQTGSRPEAKVRRSSSTSSGSLVVPIDPFAAEGLFQFDLRFSGSGSSPSSLSVSVLGSDGQPGEPTQLTHQVDVRKTAEIALAGRPDGIFFVVLESESSDESQTVELRAPRIRVAETAARSEAEPDGVRPVAAADLPNVLIVLLDAARPLETRVRWPGGTGSASSGRTPRSADTHGYGRPRDGRLVRRKSQDGR